MTDERSASRLELMAIGVPQGHSDVAGIVEMDLDGRGVVVAA
jgi:hypothetical protein